MQERKVVNQFKNITESIVYGQIVIGLLQGIFAGIGFLIFGVENALLLTMLAVIMSIIPILGPVVVYAPVGVYLLFTTNPVTTILFFAYNILLVSSIDNLLRPYLVSRKTKMSQAVVLVGMIGGLFIFGILGLILGPLILAYLITLLQAYKDKTLTSVFSATPQS